MLEKTAPIKEFMTPGVIAIDPDLSLQDAGARMSQEKVRHLMVMSDEKLHGVLSASDIINYYESSDIDPKVVTVGMAMQNKVVSCHGSDDLKSVISQMEKERINALPVIDDTGKAIGIFTSHDALGLLNRALV